MYNSTPAHVRPQLTGPTLPAAPLSGQAPFSRNGCLLFLTQSLILLLLASTI